MSEKTEKLLTTGGVAKRLQVSRRTVERWIVKGIIRAIKYPSGRFKVPESEVERIWSSLKATESQ
ncbi:helix-turn-helix domain-containing protein [Candidatus Bathyarchaeota archaeon]|nr:helix-turn-helix domain-containing protein [Candidatus Bathyarchaeota archaeon]